MSAVSMLTALMLAEGAGGADLSRTLPAEKQMAVPTTASMFSRGISPPVCPPMSTAMPPSAIRAPIRPRMRSFSWPATTAARSVNSGTEARIMDDRLAGSFCRPQ